MGFITRDKSLLEPLTAREMDSKWWTHERSERSVIAHKQNICFITHPQAFLIYCWEEPSSGILGFRVFLSG